MIFQEREALPRKTPKSVRLQSLQVLGCTPQAFKPSTCPASRLKKELRVSDRDINGVMDGGAYTSEARSWSNTPPSEADGGQDMVTVFAPGREAEVTSYRKN